MTTGVLETRQLVQSVQPRMAKSSATKNSEGHVHHSARRNMLDNALTCHFLSLSLLGVFIVKLGDKS
jgi:hypothetical protein